MIYFPLLQVTVSHRISTELSGASIIINPWIPPTIGTLGHLPSGVTPWLHRIPTITDIRRGVITGQTHPATLTTKPRNIVSTTKIGLLPTSTHKPGPLLRSMNTPGALGGLPIPKVVSVVTPLRKKEIRDTLATVFTAHTALGQIATPIANTTPIRARTITPPIPRVIRLPIRPTAAIKPSLSLYNNELRPRERLVIQPDPNPRHSITAIHKSREGRLPYTVFPTIPITLPCPATIANRRYISKRSNHTSAMLLTLRRLRLAPAPPPTTETLAPVTSALILLSRLIRLIKGERPVRAAATKSEKREKNREQKSLIIMSIKTERLHQKPTPMT